ncbi:MAG TPA: AlpA family phage regulatory protein, partial [Candidatus Methanoperedenaceae archaeon]|nr:AlpA family phage regulatory protein [Candidatus Methanoperedenaceae archaeon]
MQPPFNHNLRHIADSMGIALYQRFDLNEASLFLRCPISDIQGLISDTKLEYIQVTGNKVEFFGYQLLKYLLSAVSGDSPPPFQPSPDRIIRTKEVQDMTGLSRTSIWREERKGRFPARVALSACS